MCVVHDDMCWQSSRWVLQRGFPRIDPRVGKQRLTILLVRSLRDATLSLGARADKKKIKIKKLFSFLPHPLVHSIALLLKVSKLPFYWCRRDSIYFKPITQHFHLQCESPPNIRADVHISISSPYYNIAQEKPLNNAWPR